ncbi:MAG: iron-containing alcohol dehydrogenase [Bacteroidetes bacterium]|nr:iron-containing alcohol dehydrogenase [Bacteroidota bacterium]
MVNFKIENPTTVHFGKDVMNDLGNTIALYGKKVLLVYGGGSIKKNGIYDKALEQLKSVGAKVVEFHGIKPNPLVDDVNEAAELGRKHDVEVILAIGGGSVIDSAKVISVSIPLQTSAWRIMIGLDKPKKAIPLIAVLTLAATGTEMNMFAVLQNEEANKKIGYGHQMMYPKHSFLDPQNTFSVPRDYTAYGIADLMAHCLENYFGKGEATLSDRFVHSILNEAIEYGPKLLEDLTNYELRAKIMYAATMALNGFTAYGREKGDWGVHAIGHVLSLLYDTPHGATLSIAYIAWLKLHLNRTNERIALLGKAVFGSKNSDETIKHFESFFASTGCPVRLQQAGIESREKGKILSTMIKNKVNGGHHKLSEDDLRELVDLMDQPI